MKLYMAAAKLILLYPFANFNVNVSYVTKLPEHTIGQSAVNSLRQYGVGVEHIVRGGEQIGIYFLEKRRARDLLMLYITEKVQHLPLPM